ncbi:MAG: SUMF1/EgtB/PvdO family nonheme iron enzyme [Ardenticatenaceae bacterium]
MIGQKIDRYEIKGELGQGGMGRVYRAYDPNFGREVAIKVLPPQFLHDSTFLARFRREAQTMASLEHHAIVPVYDFGEENGEPFIVMRLMRGGSLADRLAQGALPLAEAARILGWLAPGLDEAHGRGIIHRDLKPANILFDKQHTPCISDFGIAKLTQNTQSFSATGGMIGTPEGMSPEQWRGEPLDGRSDVYGLGVILFQMLTGQAPYAAPTPAAMMFKHLTAPIPNILSIKADLPRGCQQVISRAMAKEPNNRYSTATDLATDVKQLLTGPSKPPEAPVTIQFSAPSPKIDVPELNLGIGGTTDFSPPSPKIHVPNLNLGMGTTMVSPKDGMVMVYVPAGEFLMGSPQVGFFKRLFGDAFPNEMPQRKVYLDAYWIDQTPVTNRMFAKFVAETGYQTQGEKEGWSSERLPEWLSANIQGANWQHPHGPESDLTGKWDHPVVCLSWHDAQAYCAWAGRRLPTEAEWEKAARGTDGRTYPWGDAEPNDKLLNFKMKGKDTTPVGSYPAGASPYGALDMAGNVWELTADWYDADYYKNGSLHNPTGPTNGTHRVLRGGSWNYDEARRLRAGYRGTYLPGYRFGNSGVRCAHSP